MTKYRIAYIDESEADIRRFQRFSYNYFDVIPFIPKDSVEETCNEILESHVDAVISDFEFSEQLSTVHYDGTNLVSLFLKKRENFPVFILTSFEDDAISKGEDVNIIYEKKEMDEGEKGEKFLERVKAQIEKYKHKLETDENRLLELIAESKKKKLNAAEIEELSELDSKIEKALDKESRIPNILRDDKEASDLSELLKKVDELAKKLDSKK
jgi:HPt (histidine-containing phosphotransfer) domain-containing protein